MTAIRRGSNQEGHMQKCRISQLTVSGAEEAHAALTCKWVLGSRYCYCALVLCLKNRILHKVVWNIAHGGNCCSFQGGISDVDFVEYCTCGTLHMWNIACVAKVV